MRYFVLILVLFVSPAWASHPCAVGKEYKGRVIPVETSFDFRLQGDERFMLAGVSGVRRTWNDEELTLYAASSKPDRYGRIAVHAFDEKGWVQQQSLESGVAFVDAEHEAGPCLDALRQAERVGEQEGVGLWEQKDLRFKADELEKLGEKVGHFGLVTGKVQSVGDRERRLYLNFGQNWRQDFTVVVVKKGADAFNGPIGRLKELTGKRVRVRGPIEENQGPLIRLFHETQLEIID